MCADLFSFICYSNFDFIRWLLSACLRACQFSNLYAHKWTYYNIYRYNMQWLSALLQTSRSPRPTCMGMCRIQEQCYMGHCLCSDAIAAPSFIGFALLLVLLFAMYSTCMYVPYVCMCVNIFQRMHVFWKVCGVVSLFLFLVLLSL